MGLGLGWDGGLGTGDWGLGTGDWGRGPGTGDRGWIFATSSRLTVVPFHFTWWQLFLVAYFWLSHFTLLGGNYFWLHIFGYMFLVTCF